MKSQLVELPIPTSEGIFLAHYSEKGLAALDFPNADGLVAPPAAAEVERVRKSDVGKSTVHPEKVPQKVLGWHRAATSALKAALAGRAVKELPPLDWTGKTEFQKAVWRVMLRLGPGKTKSYGEVAEAIGRPKAVRAVGSACGANSIPVLVPCHRVLAAGGKIGGFGSGLDWKRTLLAKEGIEF